MKLDITLIPEPSEPCPPLRNVHDYTDIHEQPPRRRAVPRRIRLDQVRDMHDAISFILHAVDAEDISASTYGPLADALRPVFEQFAVELERFDFDDDTLVCRIAFSDDERSAREIAMGQRRAAWDEAVKKAEAYNAETEPLRRQWQAYHEQQALLAKLQALQDGEG